MNTKITVNYTAPTFQMKSALACPPLCASKHDTQIQSFSEGDDYDVF